MSIETSKKKKGIQMPHTYIILFLIVLVVCLLTYVIPAGQFERQEDASGRMLIVPGTYTQVESSPVSPLEIPMAFVRTLGSSSVNEIIFFIFIIGGAFELIMQTGMITAFCAHLHYGLCRRRLHHGNVCGGSGVCAYWDCSGQGSGL